MNKIYSEIKKRTITSVLLLSLLIAMFLYSFIMIISLLIISVIAWIEFNGLISKIIQEDNFKKKIVKFIFKLTALIYFSLLVGLLLILESKSPHFKIYLFYSILISVLSDIGGLVVGKIFKGRKLTSISPNKTISGSIGSFGFSLLLIPFFYQIIDLNLFKLTLTTLMISLISQVGDLFISFLKRKAKVKDTSDLLPGHGGILDRIDGIIFAVPIGILLFKLY